MRTGKYFYDTAYVVKRNPVADESGKIGVPVVWKSGVLMTRFWPLVPMLRLAKAPNTPYEVKVAYTTELGILEGDVLTGPDGTEWHIEGVDQWDEETLEVFAWLIH